MTNKNPHEWGIDEYWDTTDFKISWWDKNGWIIMLIVLPALVILSQCGIAYIRYMATIS